MSRGRALRLLPLGFMAAIVFVTYAAIAWTLRRGFDWTDEAFVYTMIASNRQAVGEAWGFQHLLHPIYILTGQSVLALRIVRLVGYVLLSVMLVWCARAVVRRMGVSIPRFGWAFILLLAQVGTFLAWSYPPRYIGYNELGSWLPQLGVALILLSLAWGVSLSHDQRASWVLWRIWAGLGAVTALLVFAKVTSAVRQGKGLRLDQVDSRGSSSHCLADPAESQRLVIPWRARCIHRGRRHHWAGDSGSRRSEDAPCFCEPIIRGGRRRISDRGCAVHQCHRDE